MDLKEMMAQAMRRKARWIWAWCSHHTTSLLKLPNQAKVRCTIQRWLYPSRSGFRPRWGFLFRRRGMQGLIPRPLHLRRKGSLSYPLSATTSLGRLPGRPLALRTFSVASVASANFTSAFCALSTRVPRGIPPPSATNITLVPLPLRVRPTAWPPFCRYEGAIQKCPAPV